MKFLKKNLNFSLRCNDSLNKIFWWVENIKLNSCFLKHHCRRCGKCFCNNCCQEKVNLPRMLFLDPVRHCQVCTDISRKEEDFFEKHIKSLQNGTLWFVNYFPNKSHVHVVLFYYRIICKSNSFCFQSNFSFK